MKITCSREYLLSAFVTACSVVKANNAKAILCNIKMEALPNQVILMAGDSEIRMRIELNDVTVEDSGSVVLPPGKFRSVLTESSGETITLETEGTRTNIYVGGSRFTFPTDDPEDFPPVESFALENYYVFPSNKFCEAIHYSLSACDPSAGRAVLTGLLLDLNQDSSVAHVIATDTRRMAHYKMTYGVVGAEASMNHSAIIPKSTLQLMEKAFGSSSNEVYITIESNKLIVSNGQITVHAQLIEGTYPGWQRVFPENPVHIVEANVGSLFSGMRQASIVTTSDYPGVDLTFTDKSLTLTGQSPEQGESNVVLDSIHIDGEALVVKLLPTYVMDVLRVLDMGGTVKMFLFEGNRPVVFRPTEDLEYAVMPLVRPR